MFLMVLRQYVSSVSGNHLAANTAQAIDLTNGYLGL